MVLGKFAVPACPTLWMIVGQGPIAPAVGRVAPSLWETARYRLSQRVVKPKTSISLWLI